MDPFMHTMNEMLTTTYRSICKVEEVMLRELSGDRLSISEMHMLESIGKHGANVSATEIAQDLEITPPSVTAMLKRLEKKGFLTRERCEEDARRVQIVLTPEGRRAEIAHRFFHRQMVRAITKDFTQAECDAVLSGLQKMNSFLRAGLEKHEQGNGETK